LDCRCRLRSRQGLNDVLQSRGDFARAFAGIARKVDFSAFLFARDDWTAAGAPTSAPTVSGQASPRNHVVFEAGLFGEAVGKRRTIILHAKGAKLLRDATTSSAPS